MTGPPRKLYVNLIHPLSCRLYLHVQLCLWVTFVLIFDIFTVTVDRVADNNRIHYI